MVMISQIDEILRQRQIVRELPIEYRVSVLRHFSELAILTRKLGIRLEVVLDERFPVGDMRGTESVRAYLDGATIPVWTATV